MPRTKKSKKSARHEMIDSKTEDLISSPESISYSAPSAERSHTRWIAAVIVILAALGIFLGSRGYIVAAMVNGKPIFRWDLSMALQSRFGAQTLESMISERLIADTAQKSGVTITPSEIEAKMNNLLKSLGPNVKIEDLLKYQGMTKADFDQQIRLQLTVEKILGKDVTVEDKEVDDYVAKNRDTMTATDEAAIRGEARDTLLSQKISEKIQPWFADLKAKATIMRLVK
jgi:parvulin-like peptidyl-prolyl isomerase